MLTKNLGRPLFKKYAKQLLGEGALNNHSKYGGCLKVFLQNLEIINPFCVFLNSLELSSLSVKINYINIIVQLSHSIEGSQHDISRLQLYHTIVLMYRTVILLAHPTKVRC
jgi:hypothetical protein